MPFFIPHSYSLQQINTAIVIYIKGIVCALHILHQTELFHCIMISTTSNPSLSTVLTANHKGEQWLGTPVDRSGRFINTEHPFEPNFFDVLRWRFSSKPQKNEKAQDVWRPDIDHSLDFLRTTNDCLVWLGHACFFIRLNGISIITDPVFSTIPFTKRYTPFPYSPDIFKNINYIFISHDHRDHCDKQSLQTLVANNKGVRIISGLGMDTLMNKWLGNIPGWTSEYAGWYQQYTSDPSQLSMYYLPSRHWSKRELHDTNKRLWGAFLVKTPNKTIYISGDTGYGTHFRDVQLISPTIDYAIMGVGAYAPQWFMSSNHITPVEAAQASNIMGAINFIPMHYGTFDLSDEPISEPLRILQGLYRNGELQSNLIIPAIGESIMP